MINKTLFNQDRSFTLILWSSVTWRDLSYLFITSFCRQTFTMTPWYIWWLKKAALLCRTKAKQGRCWRSVLRLLVVLVVRLTCLAPVTLAELRSLTLLTGTVNPAGVCDSSYFKPELDSVRVISAWQPTWNVELWSVEHLIADQRPISLCCPVAQTVILIYHTVCNMYTVWNP